MKKLTAVLAIFALTTVAIAAKEAVQRTGSPSPVWFESGIYVGTPASQVDQDVAHRIRTIKVCQLDNFDIAAAAANVQVNTTGTCTGMAVGDQILAVSPLQDDAAFDDAILTGFVESANTVKIQMTADTTGADPAATNDYRILYLQH